MNKANSFKPAWWLRNPHLQTIWPTFCRPSIPELQFTRERFELPDGDFVDLDWVDKDKSNTPIVIILHGFEGSTYSSYSQGMLQAVQRQGWRGICMNFRGCSGEPNRLPNSYHSGDTRDVNAVVTSIRLREPNVPLAAIGFSLGGNILLKWLGETKHENPLQAAIAISVPFELQKAAVRISQGFSRLYQWYMLRCVQKRLELKFQIQSSPLAFPPFSSLRTLHDFDDKVTAPLNGFSGAQDYYARTSSRQFLRTIEVPTLLVQAKDDPFMTEEVIPHQDELSDKVFLEVTESGGHVGFITGSIPWRPEYWLEARVPKFLLEYFDR